MLTDIYNKNYLKLTFTSLQADIDDLANWSAYNQDQGNEEIIQLQEKFNKVKEILKGQIHEN